MVCHGAFATFALICSGVSLALLLIAQSWVAQRVTITVPFRGKHVVLTSATTNHYENAAAPPPSATNSRQKNAATPPPSATTSRQKSAATPPPSATTSRQKNAATPPPSATTSRQKNVTTPPRFECDAAHPLCERDIKLFPHLQAASEDPISYQRRVAVCQRLLQQTPRPSFAFRHLPKTGGTAVEKFLHTFNHGHAALRFWKDQSRPLLILRHPIERFVSWYYFLKACKYPKAWKEIQRHFCMKGTGREYGNECVPKLKLEEFILQNGPNGSIYEAAYLGIFRVKRGQWPSVPIGTDANFQYEWVKPRDKATLPEVKEYLLAHALVVGDSERLSDFFMMLGKLLGLSRRQTVAKTEELGVHRVNPTKHKTALQIFDKDVYAKMAERHARDIELYYWVAHQGKAFRQCFGEKYFIN